MQTFAAVPQQALQITAVVGNTGTVLPHFAQDEAEVPQQLLQTIAVVGNMGETVLHFAQVFAADILMDLQ